MAQTKYLDENGLKTLVSNIKSADDAIKTIIGTVPSSVGQTATGNVIAYVDAKAAAAITSSTYNDAPIVSRITALETKVGNSTVASQISAITNPITTNLNAEISRATDVESGILDDIKDLEGLVGSTSVSEQITSAINNLDSTVKANLDASDNVTAGNVGIKIVETDGKLTSVLVKTSDIASASELTSLQGLVGSTSVSSQIASAISGLDSTVRTSNMNTSDEITAGNVAVKIVETDGKLTSVLVKTNDIASSSYVGTIPTSATATNVVGYAKEVADAAADKVKKDLLGENGVGTEVVDTFKELQDYITSHGTEAASMTSAINALQSAGGQPNVIESVKVNNTALTITDKTVNVDLSGYVPTTRTVNSKALSGNITLGGADVKLTSYTKASTAAAVAATDTINAAIGKLEKTLEGKQASGSYANASHTHSSADITDFSTAVAAVKVTSAGYADTAGTANGLASTVKVPGSQVNGAVANATNATSATKDGDGNTISTTYVKSADIGSIDDATINGYFTSSAS